MPCVYSKSQNKMWNAENTLDICRTLSDKQKNRFDSITNAKSIISGLLVREELLKTALERKLNTTDEFMSINYELKKSHVIQYIFDNIIKVDKKNEEAITEIQSFLEDLRSDSQIFIDSSLVRSFVLNERIHI